MDDTTTFFLAFTAVFGGIAALLLHLELRARDLERRLATLEAAGAPTAKAKPDGAEPRRKA